MQTLTSKQQARQVDARPCRICDCGLRTNRSQKRNISTGEMKRFSHFCSMWPWTTFTSQVHSPVILVQHYVYNKFYTKSDRLCATLNEAHREGHIIIYILFASWLAQVTRSQAVAMIADRTASRRLWLERQFSLTGELTQFLQSLVQWSTRHYED